MKKLLKLLTVVVVLTMTTSSFAQSIGLRAGLNLANVLAEYEFGGETITLSDDFDALAGFHAGAVAEFPLSDILSIETGLLVSTQGFKFEDSYSYYGYNSETSYTVNLLYLNIPVTVRGTAELGAVSVFGQVGPYIGLGLTGKEEYEATYNGQTESEEEDVKWGSDEMDHYKRLDLGATAAAGVIFNGVEVGVSYGFGFANILADPSDDEKMNHRVLGIFAAYKMPLN